MQLSDYDAFPNTLPVIVEDELFLYPFMISPIFLSHQKDIDAVTDAMENNSLLFVTSSVAGKEGDREFDAMYKMGVIGTIMRKVQIPDGRVKILFQGLTRGKIIEPLSEEINKAVIDVVKPESFDQLRTDALMDVIRDKIKKLSMLSPRVPTDLVRTIEENNEPQRIADLVSSMLELDKEVAYTLYIEPNIEKRLLGLIDVITSEIESAKVQREIHSKVHNKIEQTNKEYFLKEQLKEIQQELGMDTQREEEIVAFREKIEAFKPHINEDAYKEISKQIDRFARMHPDSADANLLQSYLEWVLELPFGKVTKKTLSVEDVASELDKDHYSLEKPKERIVEYFSVRELAQLRGISRTETGGAILCFSGPPGVGKTSLANSIAHALGRPLVRIALGGLEDVNELRGHRRTYVGAMPGRLVLGLIEAKSMDPVIVLDEIDKVGRSMRGDPTAALLEILDPEQNSKYRDYYLNFNIDLSKAIFIATANDVGRIPSPLRDRMEFIGLNSYTPKEKFEISKRYLVPQELKKHALKKREFYVSDKALHMLIDEYTREAGVRNLRRRIAGLMRKTARILLEDKSREIVQVTKKNLHKFVDKKVFEILPVDKKPQVGVVSGLAWTAVGGDVLTIEAIKIKGKGGLQLTGSLGDVMKESVRIAYSVVKILIDERKLKMDTSAIPRTAKEKEEDTVLDPSEAYKRYDLHIHVPEGATPKDGPSAGITMVTAIASILSDKKVDNCVAMTGEVTLTGKVLPIGGLKEKLIAAYKAGVKKALIPIKNYERDLKDIPDEVKENIKIISVSSAEEVLKEALL
ncbi:MAG: endopeptidase La [Sulfurovum sp.]|nr:endopeptidase La [Sulfurovum sp.]MCB4750864.1 endopeptidase La [Sulfurovum sp.]MCB4753229.1 endopeptidase La [Sulfurovum sp.]MCB4761559.1 endopeptidase La [Sulfurovum sp.]MCB4766885.1 endopeptidase La [Sulfurovum sp.]